METNSTIPVSKSIALSRVLIFVFAAAIAALDLLCVFPLFFPDSRVLGFLRQIVSRRDFVCFAVCVFLCNVPGFLLIARMNRLLRNLQDGSVFTPENVGLLHDVSRCCIAAALICIGGVLAGLPTLLVVTLAAGFVGLIVRIVRNVFEQAILMKDELDLTV